MRRRLYFYLLFALIILLFISAVPIQATAATSYPAPPNFRIYIKSSTSVVLDWDPVPNEDQVGGYTYEMATSPGGPFVGSSYIYPPTTIATVTGCLL